MGRPIPATPSIRDQLDIARECLCKTLKVGQTRGTGEVISIAQEAALNQGVRDTSVVRAAYWSLVATNAFERTPEGVLRRR